MHTYRWNDLGFDDICWPLSSLQYLNREFSQHVPSSPTAHINTHLTLSPKVAAASQSLNWDEQHFKTWRLGPRGLVHTCTLELDKKEKKRRKRKREEKERLWRDKFKATRGRVSHLHDSYTDKYSLYKHQIQHNKLLHDLLCCRNCIDSELSSHTQRQQSSDRDDVTVPARLVRRRYRHTQFNNLSHNNY